MEIFDPPPGPGAPASSPSRAVPLQRYRIAIYGGGVEEIDRYELRERIRRREAHAETEVALAGTDEWKRISTYPELARYLELVLTSSNVPSGPQISRTVPVESVASRILPALLYPIAGGEVVVLIGIAIFQSLPGVSLLMIPVTTVYMLAIIRSSADGKTKMPAWVETDDIPGMFSAWIRAVIVTSIALWPMLLWVGIWYFATDRNGPDAQSHLVAGLVVAGILSIAYYPACLAMVAVWDSVSSALNPGFIIRTINTMRVDYGVAVLSWVIATAVAVIAAGLLNALLGPIPFVGRVPGRMLWIWAQFFGSHLLGWAIYRHAVELGWD